MGQMEAIDQSTKWINRNKIRCRKILDKISVKGVKALTRHASPRVSEIKLVPLKNMSANAPFKPQTKKLIRSHVLVTT